MEGQSKNYTRAGKPWTGVCTWDVQGLKPCHAPSVPLCHQQYRQGQHNCSCLLIATVPKLRHFPGDLRFGVKLCKGSTLNITQTNVCPSFPSPHLSGSPLSVLLWLYCRVGGVHSLRGGAAEVWRVCSHGAFRKRVLHGTLVKKAP